MTIVNKEFFVNNFYRAMLYNITGNMKSISISFPDSCKKFYLRVYFYSKPSSIDKQNSYDMLTEVIADYAEFDFDNGDVEFLIAGVNDKHREKLLFARSELE